MRFAAVCTALFVALFTLGACGDSGEQTTERSLEITTPRSGELVSANRVRVAGTATGVDEVDVNGELADVVGGEWEVIVPFSQGEATATAMAGSLTDEVTFTIDSIAPELALTAPERGLYIESDVGTTVTVSGTVADNGVGIETLKIAEQTLEVGDDGSFSYDWPVELGYSTIVVTATDLAGNESDQLRGVVVGTFDDPTAPVSNAFTVFIQEETLGELETVVENVVTPEFVKGLIDENFANESISIDTITFDPLVANVQAQNGFISVDIEVTNVVVTGQFTIDPDTFPVTINLARAAVNIDMTPMVLPDGTLDLQFSEAALDVADEDLTYTVGEDLSQDDTEFLRDLVLNFARRAFGEFVANFVLAELYDPDVLKREIVILGRTLTFELAFEDITVFPDGILARLSVTTPGEAFPEVRDVPGALANPHGTRGLSRNHQRHHVYDESARARPLVSRSVAQRPSASGAARFELRWLRVAVRPDCRIAGHGARHAHRHTGAPVDAHRIADATAHAALHQPGPGDEFDPRKPGRVLAGICAR